jgi:hypothetical protein
MFMADVENETRLPDWAKDDTALGLFREIASQHRARGWARVRPPSVVEVQMINRLADCKVIEIQSSDCTFHMSGTTKSGEIHCHLTELGESIEATVL